MNTEAQTSMRRSGVLPGEQRVQALDWEQIRHDLDTQGSAVLTHLITADECQQLAALYAHDDLFRSRINMAQHGFGRGEYQYFTYPLPELLAGLRTTLYTQLAPIATHCTLTLEPANRLLFKALEQVYYSHAEVSSSEKGGEVQRCPLFL